MKRLFFRTTIAITAVVTAVNLVFFAIDSFGFDMSVLPRGEFVRSIVTGDENKTYTVEFYRITDDKSLGNAVKAVRVTNATGERKNIYWNVGELDVFISAESAYVININGHSIDVRTQTYDWRFPKVIPDENTP